MAMQKTLLQIVQTILSDMESEDVNSISDSAEAGQVATIVEQTFYDIIALRDDIPEHYSFIKLTALGDTNFPSHFYYPARTTNIQKVWYDKSEDDSFEYREVHYCPPLEFVKRIDRRTQDFDNVSDKTAGTNLRIRNNAFPSFYTSFDDYYIVMDSYHSTYDSTLIESKVRAFGRTFPTFNVNDDDYIPDLDDHYHPYLLAEARSRSFDFFKGGSTRKAEEAVRRLKISVQKAKHKHNTEPANDRVRYGR